MSDIYNKFLKFRGNKPAPKLAELAVPAAAPASTPVNKFNPNEVIYLTCSSSEESAEPEPAATAEPEPEPEPELAEESATTESSSESSSSGDLLTREIKKLKKQDEIFLHKFGYK